MIKKGLFGDKEFIVAGVKKEKDNSGYWLEFIDADVNNRKGETVGRVFIPSGMAKAIGKGLLDQISKKDIENKKKL